MQSSKKPPDSEEDHYHGAPPSWPSSVSTSTHDQAIFNQRSFETEPPYLPGPHDHSLGAAEYGAPPSTSLGRRPTWKEADDSRFCHTTSGKPDSEQSFEMQRLGHHHLESSDNGHQVLYRQPLPGHVTPYLGLRARLTQVPINRWTVLLLLVLARMLILFGTLNTDLDDAKSDALSACDKASHTYWWYAVILGRACTPGKSLLTLEVDVHRLKV